MNILVVDVGGTSVKYSPQDRKSGGSFLPGRPSPPGIGDKGRGTRRRLAV